ncbi:hypothetical protein BofuT4_uP058270.1 [Botrytis cinerea T4]|uniref:Uncharacterized protein n=1 Tax=Botryotinia fuckeliana (strain T4) TaxID=999810 RepID=G2XUS7_BOTF4|nr:hypothetical protein BofuT4_uP058270.1 [Botrytis cinerea T4]
MVTWPETLNAWLSMLLMWLTCLVKSKPEYVSSTNFADKRKVFGSRGDDYDAVLHI